MVSEELSATISQAASTALLRIGKSYQEQDLLHQALSPYLKIVAYYPESEEAAGAVDGLVAIARMFEDQGHCRMAMSVYDRLKRAAWLRRWDGHPLNPEDKPL